jgi:NAD-dependent deacetylase
LRAIREGDVCLVIGTSATVYPAASIPFQAAEKGAIIVEINLEKTKFSEIEKSIFLKGPSGDILTLLLDEVEKEYSLKE